MILNNFKLLKVIMNNKINMMKNNSQFIMISSNKLNFNSNKISNLKKMKNNITNFKKIKIYRFYFKNKVK